MTGGRVTELDGVPEAEFDSIDTYIARHGLDLSVAEEVMALADVAFARLLVDPAVPRQEIIRLSAGATPAKLARVLALLRPPELVMAMTKLRARRTPGNQAHVTNRLDDPLLLAADAATAAAFGFREIETTVPVLDDAPSNAVACLIGAAFGADGVLIQCSVEEALELELGMRGLTSYAETVSLYGTEQVFTDGDDTPWSKAFLTSAYASRGMKMRVSSGAGAEVLMAGAQGKSMLYLEARCVALRDWGIDGGLRTVAPARLGELRREAAQACRAVYAHLGLADFTDEHVDLAVDAAGSKDLGETDTLAVLGAAHAIRQRRLTVVDIVAALDECAIFMRPNGPWLLPAPGCQGTICRRPPSSTSTSQCSRSSPTRTTTPAPAPDMSPRPDGSGRSTRSGRRAGWLTCGRRRRVSSPGRYPCSLRRAQPSRVRTRAMSSSACRRPSAGTCGGACPGWP